MDKVGPEASLLGDGYESYASRVPACRYSSGVPLAALVVAMSCSSVGCYRSHLRPPSDDAAEIDATAPDATAPDAFLAADTFVAADSASDAGPTPRALRCTSETHVVVPDGPAFDFGPVVTVEAWVRPRGAGVITEQGNLHATARFLINLTDSSTPVLFGGWTGLGGMTWGLTGDPGNGLGNDIPFPRGAWNHVAMIQEYDGEATTIELLINGAPLSQRFIWHAPVTLVTAPTGLPVVLCALDADLDEVRFWRIARTVTEINRDMRRSVAGSAGLAAYYTFDEAGQSVRDSSGNGADGTLGDGAASERTDPARLAENAF